MTEPEIRTPKIHTGTIWTCSQCGAERKRRVVPVDQLNDVEREMARLRDTLEFLADPESWLGDPHDQTSTLHGHFTPFELACRALGVRPR